MLPICLFVDDGNHRVNAAKLAGRTHIVGVHSPLSLSDRSNSMNVHRPYSNAEESGQAVWPVIDTAGQTSSNTTGQPTSKAGVYGA